MDLPEIVMDKMSCDESPPKIVYVGGKKQVSFEEESTVIEFESEITREDKSNLWYNPFEVEEFRYRGRVDDDDDDTNDSSSTGSAAVSYNHMRKVLLSYQCYKRQPNGGDHLREVSRRSSKKSREKARNRAVKLSKANDTWDNHPQNEILSMVGWNSRLATYYLESFIEMIDSGWLCGGSVKNVE
jgi:hypothetical protein